MNTASSQTQAHASYELRFRSLFNPGRGYSFPCDAAGHVDLDTLGECEREHYLYARTTVGSEFAMPAVQLSDLH